MEPCPDGEFYATGGKLSDGKVVCRYGGGMVNIKNKKKINKLKDPHFPRPH
jgi:hypothetical protein